MDLVKKLEGDRFGLIVFAGDAFLQCPLTLDYSAFRESLEQADPSVVYRGGTDIGAAIRTAEPVFAKENSFKILILITDGEDLEESGIAAATSAAKDGIKIYTVGVGTAQGELIPVKGVQDAVDYLRDAKGNIVKTKLDENTLRKIAEVTGGFYVPLGPRGEGLDKIYYSGLKNIPKQELSSNLKEIPIEQFQWPLGIGIFLLCIETIISTRRKTKKANIAISKVLVLLVGVWVLRPGVNRLEAGVSDAYRAYQEGEFSQSAVLYEKEQEKDPDNLLINYNLGSSLYKSGDYTLASNALKNAIKTQDLGLQQKVFYNLGNTYYRLGEKALQANPKQSTELWEEALKYYENAVELDPKDIETQENLEFVKKKLEKLKQQQQQNQQNQQDKKDKENQEDQKEDSQDNKDESDGEDKSSENPNGGDKDNEGKDKGGKDGEDNKQSDNQDKKEEPSSKESTQNGSADEDKETQKDKGNSNPSEGDKREQAGKQDHRRMNKEEAGEILKALQNSEKKLPVVGDKGDKKDYSSKDLKDW